MKSRARLSRSVVRKLRLPGISVSTLRRSRLISAFWTLFLCACTQEPLFFYISTEVAPIKPIIGGAPSQIARLTAGGGDVFFVTNTKSVWKYDINGNRHWEQIPGPDGAEDYKTVAVTTTSPPVLYLLTGNGAVYEAQTNTDGTLAGSWTRLSGVPGHIQQLFGAGANLYAGSFSGNSGALYVFDGTNWSSPLMGTPSIPIPPAPSATPQDINGLLTGAVQYNTNYYVSLNGDTSGEGVYNLGTTGNSNGVAVRIRGNVKGIIEFDSNLVAAGADGRLWTYNASVLNSSATNQTNVFTLGTSRRFSGALAVWEHGTDKLLLAGLRSDGDGLFDFGYRELETLPAGAASWEYDQRQLRIPGSAGITSIDPGIKETSGIGKHPVNALVVVPAPGGTNQALQDSGDGVQRPIVMASTQQNGVWSYRVRTGGPQWNGENNR